MLNLRNINVNAHINSSVVVKDGERVPSAQLCIEIEVFGQLSDEQALSNFAVIEQIGDALVEAIDTNAITNKATLEIDGVMQEWDVPLVEAGEQLETDGLPWEFRCRRGAKGEGRWTVEYEIELIPPAVS